MKKAFCIVFSFFYLLTSAGISLNVHYCGGKLKNISLFHTDEGTCCGKSMQKKKNCCKEKSVEYKVKETQNGGKSVLIETAGKEIVVPFSLSLISIIALPSINYVLPDLHAPPDTGPGIYLENRVFRI